MSGGFTVGPPGSVPICSLAWHQRFMLVSTQFVYFQHYGKNDLVTIDTSRIAASVVTGVGFLGGGAILRIGANVLPSVAPPSVTLMPF